MSTGGMPVLIVTDDNAQRGARRVVPWRPTYFEMPRLAGYRAQNWAYATDIARPSSSDSSASYKHIPKGKRAYIDSCYHKRVLRIENGLRLRSFIALMKPDEIFTIAMAYHKHAAINELFHAKLVNSAINLLYRRYWH